MNSKKGKGEGNGFACVECLFPQEIKVQIMLKVNHWSLSKD